MKENVFNDPKYLKEFVLQILFLALKFTRYIFCDFLWFFNWCFSLKKRKAQIFIMIFWWVYWSETQKKMKNINLVTLWLHISFSRATSSSQKMPNFSLEKLRRQQQSWCAEASRRKNLPKRRQFPLLMISDALT